MRIRVGTRRPTLSAKCSNPARNIPFSVVLGTLLVSLLYLGLNAAFMRTTPASEMVGKEQVALIAGQHIFGTAGGKVMALFICAGLISAVSAMMWIGPRVTATMGQDFHALRWLARTNAHGIPRVAILVQFAIVNVLLLTATFQAVVNYVQFSLALCCAATVLGVFVLRWREPICHVHIARGVIHSRQLFFSRSVSGCSGTCSPIEQRATLRFGVWRLSHWDRWSIFSPNR